MAIVTEVSVINDALALLGAGTISSRTENTEAARVANRIFDTNRDAVLRAHPWNFAIKRASLANTGTTPTFTYDYAFTIPSDCLRVLGVTEDIDGTETDDVPHKIEQGEILCDESSIYVMYIFREDNPENWDAKFAEALSAKLAFKMSYSLTQSLPLQEQMKKYWEQTLSEARSFDGMEGTMDAFIVDTWLDARR